MQIILSNQMIDSINALVHSHSMYEVLDVYEAATSLQQLHPRDNVALEDIMNEIVLRMKPGSAISFDRSETTLKANQYSKSDETVSSCDIGLSTFPKSSIRLAN